MDPEVALWVPRALGQSESFTLRLTDMVSAAKEVSQRQSGLEGPDGSSGGLLSVTLSVLQAGELSDGQIKELCGIWFG